MQRFIFLCTLSFLCTCVRAQGPISGFPMPKGEVAIALSYSGENYSNYFLNDDQTEARDVETISYSLFVEAGLSDNTALVATLPWMRTNNRQGSLQDGSIWLKYMNLDKRGQRATNRFFTAVGLSFPVGNYETSGNTAIGQRATVFQGRFAYQYQHDSGWFLNAQTGIDFQFSPETQSAFPILLRTGYGGKYFYTEAWFESVSALESNSNLQSATAGTGSSWRRVGGTLYFPVSPWFGLNFGGAWVLSGNFIGDSSRLNVGVVVQL